MLASGGATSAPSSLKTFAELCRSKGIRLTGQRRAIAAAFFEGLDHPSADQIHETASLRHPGMSLSTVYRTVRMLRDAGIIIEHEFQDGRCHYELAGRPHHDHLIDTENGTITEFCDPEIERLQQAIANRLGYRLTGHRLELYGVRRR
jgi:Fur family ferric uptake transcriptional regulator